jgi:hypothetical protein
MLEREEKRLNKQPAVAENNAPLPSQNNSELSFVLGGQWERTRPRVICTWIESSTCEYEARLQMTTRLLLLAHYNGPSSHKSQTWNLFNRIYDHGSIRRDEKLVQFSFIQV